MASSFEKLNFFREGVRHKKANADFRKNNPNVILPPDFYLYETFALDYKKYYEGGYETARWLYDHFQKHITVKNISILDWGCGPARTIRHLPSIAGEDNQYFGSDYNEDYVQWCADNIQNVTFKKNELAPPLDFSEDFFEIIYGISIFTHLSEEMHHKWMLELSRVLKKGGILFLTTHGEVTKQKLPQKDQDAFDKGQLIVQNFKKEGNRLFAAYQPRSFFKSLCESCHLKVIDHIPGEVKNGKPLQDIWILTK